MKVTTEQLRDNYVRVIVEVENERFIEACGMAYERMKHRLLDDGEAMSMEQAVQRYGSAMFHGLASRLLIEETLPKALEAAGIRMEGEAATDVLQISDTDDLIYSAVVLESTDVPCTPQEW